MTCKSSHHSEVTPIQYPKPDNVLSFDILTSVARTGTNHAEGQPSHLQLPREAGAKKRHTEKNVVEYGGLLGNACPAAVYEYQDVEGEGEGDAAGKKFVINSQNCIHVSSLFWGDRMVLVMAVYSMQRRQRQRGSLKGERE